MAEVPEYVSRAAERHGLGPMVVWRKGSNPFATFVVAVGITVVGGGLLIGVLWVLSRFIDQLETGVAAIVILAGVALVGSAVVGVYGLFKGFTAHFVYERGAIQTRNRRVNVQAWAQLDEVLENWGGLRSNPKVLSIFVRFFDGRRWEIEAATSGDQTDRDAPLVAVFIDMARRQGRPVTRLPRVKLEDEFMPPRWLVGVLVVLLFAVSFVVWRSLRDSGLADGLPLAIGFLTAGLGTWVLGQAFRWVRVSGWLFTAIGGLILITVATRLLPSVNGWVVGLSTFALELLAVWGLGRVNAMLMPPVGSIGRFLYAITHRWRFRPRAHIALPGPATAARLLSVPPWSTSTEGRSVVTFEVNGRRVVVFDRVRPSPRIADVPQTVWMVQLPQPVPFQALPDGTWVDGTALWYARESLFRMGASPRRVAAVAARLAAAVQLPATTYR